MSTSGSEFKQLMNEVVELKKEFSELIKSNTDIKASCKDIKNKLHGLVEIQTRLIHNQLDAPIPMVPKAATTENKGKNGNYKIEISLVDGDNGRIKVTGKGTFDYKNVIKNAGYATFDKNDKYWSLDKDSLESLVEHLVEAGLVYNSCFAVNVPGFVMSTPTQVETVKSSTNRQADTQTDNSDGFGVL